MESKLSMEDDRTTIFVGLVCLDIVTAMDHFPVEDIGQRCQEVLWQRGGNAGNSATVLSILGGKSALFGTLSNTTHTHFMTDDLNKNGVTFDNCITLENTACPTSIVILNKSRGTRTILHTNPNLPELTLEDFCRKIDLSCPNVGWIHFEGRDNAEEISRMLSYVNEFFNDKQEGSPSSKRVQTSLEAEKLRLAAGMDKFNMWTLPDVLFVSKDFARSQGYEDMKSAVQAYSSRVKDGAVVVCAWGEDGAAAMPNGGDLVVSQPFPPKEIVDTCGAGDTFNAAVIRALSQGKSLKEAIEFGCRVAGAKCGCQGFDELKDMSFS